jgi:hypothetical protein
LSQETPWGQATWRDAVNKCIERHHHAENVSQKHVPPIGVMVNSVFELTCVTGEDPRKCADMLMKLGGWD